MKIVCLDAYTLYPIDDFRWNQLKKLASDVLICDRTKPSQVVERAEDADILLTNKVYIGADTIAALPDLKYIGVLATGYNVVDIEAARKAGITVCNIPAYSTNSVAQHTFALLLAVINKVESYTERVKGLAWSASQDFTFRVGEWSELAGKTFGIVGYGNIGKAVAKIATAMGMKVALYTSKPVSELPKRYVKMELDELFMKSDVVSLHCPLTPETQKMVDARRLALMRPNAILLNTARGPLVDEKALAAALNERRIAGAGLDVLENEPPKVKCPLHLTGTNCVITPHIAWASAEARERLFAITLKNIKAFLAGKPINVVS